MLSAILSQDYLKAQSIQQGLRQSSLKTLIYKTDFPVCESYDFLYHDGFFVFVEDPDLSHLEFCKRLKKLISKKNMYLLLGTENLPIVNAFREALNVPIFLPPFSYRKIAGLFASSQSAELSFTYSHAIGDDVISLDASTRTLSMNGEGLMSLSNKEYLLLQFLITHPHEIISKYDLMDTVWGRNILSSTATIDVHMSRVRKKMKAKFQMDPVKTIHCAGYIFG